MWNEEMAKSSPKTAAAEINCLKTMLKNISQSILDYDDADTASQNRRSRKRMLDMAKGVKSMTRDQGESYE